MKIIDECERYEYLLGKKHEIATPLSIARCGCGMLLLTTPEGTGAVFECRSCKLTRENYGPPSTSYRAPRVESRSLLVVGLLVAVLFCWLGARVYSAPAQPLVIEAAE